MIVFTIGWGRTDTRYKNRSTFGRWKSGRMHWTIIFWLGIKQARCTKNILCCFIVIKYTYLWIRKITLLQILQLVSGQSDTLVDDTIKCKEENIDDTQKVWMDADQEKQLASILDETKGWKKLAHHFNFKYLLNIFEQSSSSSTLLLLNYIAVRISFFHWIFRALCCIFLNARSYEDKTLNYVIFICL